MSAAAPSALKEIFDAHRFRHIATETAAVYPAFDRKGFLALTLPKLEELTLMQRLRLMTESLHTTLPTDFRKAVSVLRRLAPRINRSFVTLILPDYVGLYGLENFDVSMDALKFFTPFGSSEFAVRKFLRQDLARTLTVMETWSRDENEAVRRLASEGCRPRLPWSFHLDALIADPSPCAPILENLRADSSRYVRKSVANHLNDITKDHREWVLDRVESWPQENPATAWIVKRALRTLIKKGDRRALAVIGAGEKPRLRVDAFKIHPATLQLGERVALACVLTSKSAKSQRLVVDYVIHYVKKSGSPAGKVFKWKELTLGPRESVSLQRHQRIQDFTTRAHHAGRHAVDLLVNGENLAQSFFDLSR